MFSGSVDRGDGSEGEPHGGCGRGEQRGEDRGGIEAALVGGAQHARENLLTPRAARRAIAAAAHLARHDSRAQGLLGAPVGGVECRLEEEAEDGVVLADEMALKAPYRQPPTRRPLQQPAEAFEIVPAGDGQPMRGDRPADISRACAVPPARSL